MCCVACATHQGEGFANYGRLVADHASAETKLGIWLVGAVFVGLCKVRHAPRRGLYATIPIN